MKVRVKPVYDGFGLAVKRSPFGLLVGSEHEVEHRLSEFGDQFMIKGQDCWLPAYVFEQVKVKEDEDES